MRFALPLALLVIACLGPFPAAGGAAPPDGTVLQRFAVELDGTEPASVRELTGSVQVERIVYASDGLEVEGYLARPLRRPSSSLPCVIFLRGGNRNFGALDDARALGILGRIAARGYVVAATQYRGNGRFGPERYPGARTCAGCGQPVGGPGREEFGGAEVRDVLALLPLLEQVPEADADRVGLYGWSRGGMMTYLTLRAGGRFRAAVVGAGLADAAEGLGERPDMAEHVYAELIPGWQDEARRRTELVARSAVRWADELPATTPILILHGTADWRVAPTQALAMAGELLRARRPYRLVMFEGGDHGLTEHRAEVDRLVDEWLDRYVRDAGGWPSLEPHGR